MKFGIVFGGGSKTNHLYCSPLGNGVVDVKNVFKNLGVLPIYETVGEALAQGHWFNFATPCSGWKRGEFDEAEQPKKGAEENKNGLYVRSAKKCNKNETYKCEFNKDSLSRWSKWNSQATPATRRALVRDKRSNTRQMKILWSGVHIPGEDGVPDKCYISNAWNYFVGSKDEVIYVSSLMNSPIADLAIRSIASKRNVNPKDLNLLGLPAPSNEIKKLIVLADANYELKNSIILKIIFEMDQASIELLINNCEWLSKDSKTKILNICRGDLDTAIKEFNKSLNSKKKQTVASRKAG